MLLTGVQPVITLPRRRRRADDFEFDGKEYTPNNYGEKFMGRVTVRDALTNSLNCLRLSSSELIGYGRVVQLHEKWA